MQTFLPYPDFERSSSALDMRRLGKQRVECSQVLKALAGNTSGWRNHPATLMWLGHEQSLCLYAIRICTEWRTRGYKDTLLPFFQEGATTWPDTGAPTWLGDTEFHRSHQSNLIRKLPEHYRPLFPGVPDDLPYVWPQVKVTS